jgi:hypothetical protein
MKPLLSCLIAATFAISSATAVAQTSKEAKINKCQDATGKWHYGDTADEACARSKITVINNQGIAKKEIAPPATAEELKRQEAREAEIAMAKERAKQDAILLSTYSHEADITFVRDRKIAQIEANIKASNATLASLRKSLERAQEQEANERKAGAVSEQTAKMVRQNEQQVQSHEAAIAKMRQEQEQVKQRAEADLKRYRELRGTTTTAKP